MPRQPRADRPDLVATVGRIPLLLLDSDLAGNDEEMRAITDRLYGGDQNHRIVAGDPARNRRHPRDREVHFACRAGPRRRCST